MKSYSKLFIFMACVLLVACGGEPSINGRNDRAASSTMRKVMRQLPQEQRLEFEIAYWTTRESFDKNREFLDTIDDKTAPEVIILGQKYFSKRKAMGIPAYTKYESWDDMLTKVTAERKANEIPRSAMRQDDKANNVLYKLSNL